MSIPDVRETIEDGALGLVTDSTDQICLKLGVCSLGTPLVIQSFSDRASLKTALGAGPVVDAAALSLDTAGGPVYVMPIAASTPGSAGSVTHLTGTQTAVPTISGAPNDQYDVQLQITRAGANLAANTAALKYTLDGGDNWSQEVAVPTGGAVSLVGTNMTATFADGTFVAGDVFKFTTTAPAYSLSDLTTAVNAALADPRTWGFIHVVGPASTPSGSASMLATLDTLMSSAEAAFRYAFAIMEAPDDEAASNANLITAFASSASKRVMVCAGYAEVLSSMSGLIRKRSSAWPIAARCAKVGISEDLGAVEDGPIVGVDSLYHDEQATPNLDAARFSSLRTIIGRQGFYVTNGNMFSPAGSDFKYVQFRRVMDRACADARQGLLEYLNSSLRLDPNTGFILESEAQAIEADVNGQMVEDLVNGGDASSTSIKISRTANILSTGTMPTTVRVEPLGYAKQITIDIGFVNQALVAK
jgi:hypothetical protein